MLLEPMLISRLSCLFQNTQPVECTEGYAPNLDVTDCIG